MTIHLTLLLQLLNSISDGPATAIHGNNKFRHHLQQTTDVLLPDVSQESVLTLAAYHFLTLIGK